MDNQLSLFDLPPPVPAAPAAVLTKCDRTSIQTPNTAPAPESFSPGTRIRITQAGPPLEHLNGQKGEIVSVMQGLASVQVEGIAVAIMLRFESLEKYSEISQYITAFDDVADPIIVGSIVECDRAFLGLSGVVRQIEAHGDMRVAWVDYGSGKPLYPSLIESLSLV